MRRNFFFFSLFFGNRTTIYIFMKHNEKIIKKKKNLKYFHIKCSKNWFIFNLKFTEIHILYIIYKFFTFLEKIWWKNSPFFFCLHFMGLLWEAEKKIYFSDFEYFFIHSRVFLCESNRYFFYKTQSKLKLLHYKIYIILLYDAKQMVKFEIFYIIFENTTSIFVLYARQHTWLKCIKTLLFLLFEMIWCATRYAFNGCG